MSASFSRMLRADLEEQLLRLEEGILSGAKDWIEYREMVGQRRGLQKALSALDEVSRTFDALD